MRPRAGAEIGVPASTPRSSTAGESTCSRISAVHGEHTSTARLTQPIVLKNGSTLQIGELQLPYKSQAVQIHEWRPRPIHGLRLDRHDDPERSVLSGDQAGSEAAGDPADQPVLRHHPRPQRTPRQGADHILRDLPSASGDSCCSKIASGGLGPGGDPYPERAGRRPVDQQVDSPAGAARWPGHPQQGRPGRVPQQRQCDRQPHPLADVRADHGPEAASARGHPDRHPRTAEVASTRKTSISLSRWPTRSAWPSRTPSCTATCSSRTNWSRSSNSRAR